jgi:hypothetical protein
VDWVVSAEVLRDSRPTSDWQLESVDVLSDGVLFAQAAPAIIPIKPLPALWPDGVWTVRIQAVQHDNFFPKQIWILNNVPVTNALEWTVEREEQRQVGSHKVTLLGFRGPQVTWSGTNGGGGGQSTSGRAGDIKVCFAAPHQAQGVRITFVRGHDDLGRTLTRAGYSWSPPTAPWNFWDTPATVSGQSEIVIHGYDVSPPPGAKTLSLEFAVHETRSVDFVVKPTFRK